MNAGSTGDLRFDVLRDSNRLLKVRVTLSKKKKKSPDRTLFFSQRGNPKSMCDLSKDAVNVFD